MNINMSSPTSYIQSIPSTIHSTLPPSLHPFFLLSYPVRPSTSRLTSLFESTKPETLYSKGPEDVYIVITCAIGFTILREFTMRYILSPLARFLIDRPPPNAKSLTRPEERLRRRRVRHLVTRFAEQGWSFLYCTAFWTIGGIILWRIPSPFSPEQLWGTYPVTLLPGLTKFYYLAQLGWWFHQIYVINTEKRRKDHWQMFTHHILSICLIVTSYAAHFTRVGTVIHFLMDFCDILLPFAKMLRYLSFTTVCDAAFGLFLVGWLVSRQIGLFLVIRTSIYNAPKFIPFEWVPEKGHFLTRTTYTVFIGMQAFLLLLQTIWFTIALRVALRVVRGDGAEDTRSDDEDEILAGTESPLEDVPDAHVPVSAGKGIVENGVGKQQVELVENDGVAGAGVRRRKA